MLRHSDFPHDKSVQVFCRTRCVADVGQDPIAEEGTRLVEGVQHLVGVPACSARLRLSVENEGDDLATEASTVAELSETSFGLASTFPLAGFADDESSISLPI